jgi:triosephosphate isomerase
LIGVPHAARAAVEALAIEPVAFIGFGIVPTKDPVDVTNFTRSTGFARFPFQREEAARPLLMVSSECDEIQRMRF